MTQGPTLMSDYNKTRFTDKELIGEGAYGSVFKAYDEDLGMYVIIKKTKDKEPCDDEISGVRTTKEVIFSDHSQPPGK